MARRKKALGSSPLDAQSELPNIVGQIVTGARGDLYDGKGALIAKDVEVAPYVKIEMTLPATKDEELLASLDADDLACVRRWAGKLGADERDVSEIEDVLERCAPGQRERERVMRLYVLGALRAACNVSDRSDTTPDDAQLGAEFIEEVAKKLEPPRARVTFVSVPSAGLVQFDGEHAVDQLIATPIGALRGAIVKVAPILRSSFRDAFDAGAVAQSARDRGAVAVIVSPRIVADTRIDDRKAEAVRTAGTPRDAIAAWFGELAGLTDEDRAACIAFADDLMDEEER